MLQSGLVFEDATSGEIEAVTAKVLDLATAFDQDLGATTAAVGQLIKTGLVKDADEGLDLVTRGMQEGADKSGDLLDTLNEYPTQFRDLGLSGQQAMGLLVQGLRGGARDADIVADALKEFAIRAKDGSATTAAGFKALGLSGKEMTQVFAKGGPDAAKALDTVLDRLRGVEDPAKRSQIAVQLFGTQAEDLQDALFALDPSQAVMRLGNVDGAAAKLGETLADNAQTKIEGFRRKADQMLVGLVNAPGVFGSVTQAAAGFGGAILPIGGDLGGMAIAMGGVSRIVPGLVGSIGGIAGFFGRLGLAALRGAGQVAVAFGQMAVQAAIATGKLAAQVAVQVGRWVFLGVQSLLNAAKVAAAWLIAMGPIALIVAAVVVAVVLIIKNWGKVKAFLLAAWNAIKAAASAVWTGIKTAISTAVTAVINFVKAQWTTLKTSVLAIWNAIKTGISTVWTGIKTAVSAAITFVKTLITNQLNLIKTVWTTAWNTVKAFVTTAWTGIKTAVSTGITNLVTFVKGIPGKILSALGNLKDLLFNLGRDAFESLKRGLESIVGNILGIANDIKNRLIGVLNPANWFSTPEEHYRKLWGSAFGSVAEEARRALPAVGRAAERLATAAAPASAFGGAAPVGRAAPTVAGVALAGAGGGVMGGTWQAEIPVVVNLDGRAIFRAEQTHTLRYKQRNGKTGY